MTGPEFPKGFWIRHGTVCIYDQDRRHAVRNVMPLSNLFTELRPVCGFCDGDSVVLCGITYDGTEEAVVLRDYGFDFTGDGAVIENIRNRRCINGIAKELSAKPTEQGRKPASHSARCGQDDPLHPDDHG